MDKKNIEIITSIKKIQARSDTLRCLGKKIALIPTMGFLHKGHLSLISEGKKYCDDIVLSIYVNPTQFAPGEDLETYPKSLEQDIELAQKQGANVVFLPEDKQIYQDGFQTYVELEKLPHHLCGMSRPTHFKGVATVVTKLFNIVKPHIAVFGQKDFQQLAVIKRMVQDLNFDIKIIGIPTVREADGLAMSSRNSNLTKDQRKSALALHSALLKAQNLYKNRINDASRLIKAASNVILSKPDLAIDYIQICDPETLESIETLTKPTLMALAVKIGKTRLIDNMILYP